MAAICTLSPPPNKEEWAIIGEMIETGKMYGYQIDLILYLLRIPDIKANIEQALAVERKWHEKLKINTIYGADS